MSQYLSNIKLKHQICSVQYPSMSDFCLFKLIVKKTLIYKMRLFGIVYIYIYIYICFCIVLIYYIKNNFKNIYYFNIYFRLKNILKINYYCAPNNNFFFIFNIHILKQSKILKKILI
jgi:hypothetical protein